MIEIKKLPPSRWKDFRDLRLEALQNEPLAFASSYEEEKKFTQDEWKRRIKKIFEYIKISNLISYFVMYLYRYM